MKLEKLKAQLSAEFNKPKAKNINGDFDNREPRSPKKIKELQTKIAKKKAEIR